MKKLMLVILLTLLTCTCLSATINKFTEDNDMWISVDDKAASNNMTEARFNTIVDSVSTVYAPIVAARGAKLVMVNNWLDGTVNAYADRTGDVWNVHMFGGLARHILTTDDGFAMVVCHELGHHLAGFPKYSDNDWASNEGQSDYWASLKCFRKVIAKQNNVAIMKKAVIDPIVKARCTATYKTAVAIATCERIAMGGLSLGKLLGSLGGEAAVSFGTPNTSVVVQTVDEHPAAQCRLDTYFAGILCNVSENIDVSDIDEKIGTCNAGGYLKGERPACWFKKQ